MEEIMTNQRALELERIQGLLRTEGISSWKTFWHMYQEATVGKTNRFKDLLGYTITKRTDGGYSYYRSTNSYLDRQYKNYFYERGYDPKQHSLPVDLRAVLQRNRGHLPLFVKWLRKHDWTILTTTSVLLSRNTSRANQASDSISTVFASLGSHAGNEHLVRCLQQVDVRRFLCVYRQLS